MDDHSESLDEKVSHIRRDITDILILLREYEARLRVLEGRTE